MIDASQRDIGSCRGLNGHGLSARHFHDLVVSTGIDRDHITILCSVKRSLNRCIRIGADMDGISRRRARNRIYLFSILGNGDIVYTVCCAVINLYECIQDDQ